MSLPIAPNASEFMTARIRQESYFNNRDRYVKGNLLHVREINDSTCNIEFYAPWITLVRLNDIEFLWIFAYANHEYNNIVNGVKTTNSLKEFKCFNFATNEWIYLPKVVKK